MTECNAHILYVCFDLDERKHQMKTDDAYTIRIKFTIIKYFKIATEIKR